MFRGIFLRASSKRIDGYEVTQDKCDLEDFKNYPRETWRRGDDLHRDDGPAVIVRHPKTGEVVLEQHWKHGHLHRDGAPAVIERFEGTGEPKMEQYWQEGLLTREDGPAQIEYHGTSQTHSWYRNNQLHHEERPAIETICSNGVVEMEEWYLDGKLHRDDAPARVFRHEETGAVEWEEWRQHGLSHRDNGPAYREWDITTGIVVHEIWRQNGETYRADGPAELYRNPQTGEAELPPTDIEIELRPLGC